MKCEWNTILSLPAFFSEDPKNYSPAEKKLWMKS